LPGSSEKAIISMLIMFVFIILMVLGSGYNYSINTRSDVGTCVRITNGIVSSINHKYEQH